MSNPVKRKKKFSTAKEGGSDDIEKMTMTEFVTEKVNDKFIDLIPVDSIRELPSHYMYLFGGIANFAMLLCFAYFTYQGYQQGLTQKFISLDPTSGQCDSVPRPLTGAFLGSSQGQWQGNDNFMYSQAMYFLDLFKYEATPSEYSSMMNSIQTKVLAKWAAIGVTQNLAYNLLIWMGSTEVTRIGGAAQLFQLTGTPSIVFNGEYIFGSVANSNQFCAVPSINLFSDYGATLTMIFNLDKYSKWCNQNYPPDYYTYFTNASEFSIDVDTQTIVTAMSVNLNYLSYDYLEEVVFPFETYNDSITIVNGVQYTFNQAFDTRYPGMENVYCFQPATDTPGLATLCVVCIGEFLCGVPTFNHAGYDLNRPSYCDCSSHEAYEENCNMFSFLVGVILFDDWDLMIQFLFSAPPAAINKAAYNASLIAAMGSYNPTLWQDPGVLHEAFAFCDYQCSVLSFGVLQMSNQAVSPYFYQVTNGSCSDSFTTALWPSLEANPPGTLTESYYECTSDWSSSLFNSLGIAAGNTSTLVPLVVTLLLPLIYLYLKSIGYTPPKEEYSKDEKELTTHELALQLLRARDGKIRGIRKNGEIHRLARDLVFAAKSTGGYPDSDDESDTDDDRESRASKAPLAHRKGDSLPLSEALTSSSPSSSSHRRAAAALGNYPVRKSSTFAIIRRRDGEIEVNSDDEYDREDSAVFRHSVLPAGTVTAVTSIQSSSHNGGNSHAEYQLMSSAHGKKTINRDVEMR